MENATRTCLICLQSFPLTNEFFRRDVSQLGGFRARCKTCHNLKVAPKDAEERFWRDVKKCSECWLWQGCLDGSGYGLFTFKTKAYRAHRFSFVLHKGEIGKGLWVLHKCDTPNCVNPEHLYAGTPAENTADMVSRNRNLKGSEHRSAKLTAEQVIEMRQLYSTRIYTYQALGDKFGINTKTAWKIVNRRSWRHLS